MKQVFRLDARLRFLILSAIVLATLLFVMFLEPVEQELEYHNFSDQRNIFGIPNFFDVISNIPFFFIGILGLRTVAGNISHDIRPAWNLFFAGITAVCFGSIYYHTDPNNDTLVWDRFPMVVGFMGLLSALVGEYLDEKLGRGMLVPALVIGLFSLMYWQLSGDLRLYIWVQGVTVLIIPVLAFLFKCKYTHQRFLFYAVFLYILAKVFEFQDQAVYSLTNGLAGGHALKHLLAATSLYMIVRMLEIRKLKTISK